MDSLFSTLPYEIVVKMMKDLDIPQFLQISERFDDRKYFDYLQEHFNFDMKNRFIPKIIDPIIYSKIMVGIIHKFLERNKNSWFTTDFFFVLFDRCFPYQYNVINERKFSDRIYTGLDLLENHLYPINKDVIVDFIFKYFKNDLTSYLNIACKGFPSQLIEKEIKNPTDFFSFPGKRNRVQNNYLFIRFFSFEGAIPRNINEIYEREELDKEIFNGCSKMDDYQQFIEEQEDITLSILKKLKHAHQ